MAGPVWRRSRETDLRCDGCLKRTDRPLQEGEVVEAEFRPSRTLCEQCYETHHVLIAKSGR